ncbi:P2X purinoceptor 4 isoform X8 [Macaca mulatta]
MPPRGSQFQTGRWRPPLGPGPRPPGAASFRALPMMTALRAGRADWAGLRAGTGTQTGSGTGSRRCGHGGLLRRAGGLPVRVRHAAHRAHPQPQSGAHEPRRAAAHPGLRHRQENSLFVMTNMILTMNQTQDLCPEIPDVTTVCKSDANCTAGSAGTHSNGVSTGRCVPFNRSVKTCEVAAWCPVEDDTHVPQPAFLKAAENFTLLVKNNIWYPKFNFSKRNILPNITTTYLKSCIYDAKTDPFCPIFRLGKIVENAGHSFQDMAVEVLLPPPRYTGCRAQRVSWLQFQLDLCYSISGCHILLVETSSLGQSPKTERPQDAYPLTSASTRPCLSPRPGPWHGSCGPDKAWTEDVGRGSWWIPGEHGVADGMS